MKNIKSLVPCIVVQLLVSTIIMLGAYEAGYSDGIDDFIDSGVEITHF